MKWKTMKKRLLKSGPLEEEVRIDLTSVHENGKSEEHEFFSTKTAEAKPASYREMLRYAEFPDYLLLFFGLFFSVLDGACAPLGSVIFRGITDVLMTGQAAYLSGEFNYDDFAQRIIYYCILYFLQGLNMFVLTVLAIGCFYTLSERMSHKIKKHFFEAVLKQDQEWFDKNDVGALTQLMSSGIEKIRQGTSDKMVIMIKATANLISGIAIAFYFSPKLTFVMLILAPFMIFSLYLCHKTLISQTKKESTAYSVCGSIAEEVLSTIKTVMSFNAQNFEIKRYSKSLKKAEKVGFQKALIVSICTGIHASIDFVTVGIGFYYGSTLVFGKEITAGTVFGVFWCIFIGSLRFGMAVPQFSTLIKAKVAAGEIFQVIDTKPKLKRIGGLSPKAIEGRIEFKDIHFRYPSRPTIKVLEDISFTVEPGQNVALVGHSGSGKSTVIGLLMRYYEQESGSVTIDGIPLEDLNVEWLRSTIGIVSQEPVLFQATVAENLRLGKDDVTREEMEEVCRMANAHEFIVKLQNGYDTQIGDGGIRLSGGQKQRLAIARALIRRPRILLLDEATSALDTESERLVQTALDRASSGRTTITVAHRLSTVRNADKIIVFDHGQIVESGTHDELFAKEDGFYRQLVLAQQIDKSNEKEADSESVVEKKPIRRRTLSSDSYTADDSLLSLEEAQETTEMEELLKKSGAEPASASQILKYAKPEMKLFITGLLLSLIRGCAWPVFAVLYGIFFKILSNPDDSSTSKLLYIGTFGFLILGVMSGFTTWLSGYIMGLVGEKLNVRLRMDVYKNLMRQDASYYDNPNHSVGKLTARLATDSNNIQAAADQRLADVLKGFTSFFVGLGVAFYFGYQMALFCILASGIFIIIQYGISKSVKKRALADTHLEDGVSTLTSESITQVKTIQSLVQERKMCEKFNEFSKNPLKRAIVRGWLMSCTIAIGACFVSMNFASSYLVGLLMIKLEYCSPFTVFQVIESLNVATMMVMATVSYFPEYTRAKLSAGLIFHMLKEKPKIDNLSEGGLKSEIKGNVELKDIDFSYPNGMHTLTLNKMNIKANFGQTVAIVGASGCGKSTVIQLIERFYDVLGGVLRVDGQDIRQMNVRHLRSSMALVGQEPTLFNLSIGENISYGLENVSLEKVKAAARLANMDEFIDSLPDKYDTCVGGRGTQLSGGQRQRIAIARAILREPKILLLDEATAALDGESEKLVQEALDRARDGRTCLVVAHRLSTIQNADLIYVLDNGKVIETGNHQQLLAKNGLYAKLVEKQTI